MSMSMPTSASARTASRPYRGARRGVGSATASEFTAALHARWAGSDHLPCARGHVRVRVRGWVGAKVQQRVQCGLCGALRSWGLFVLGFRCMAWTLRL
jgi:hypothetical protein